MADWKKSVSGNGFALWDKGYTWGSVDDLSKYGKTGWEAELFTGRSGSKGLKTFASVDTAKAYIERSTADARNKQQARDAKALDSAKRARLHRALDAVLSSKAKDAKADGTYSPDEEADEKILLAKVAKTIADFHTEAFRIGGSFRGPGIWARVKTLIKSVS